MPSTIAAPTVPAAARWRSPALAGLEQWLAASWQREPRSCALLVESACGATAGTELLSAFERTVVDDDSLRRRRARA